MENCGCLEGWHFEDCMDEDCGECAKCCNRQQEREEIQFEIDAAQGNL